MNEQQPPPAEANTEALWTDVRQSSPLAKANLRKLGTVLSKIFEDRKISISKRAQVLSAVPLKLFEDINEPLDDAETLRCVYLALDLGRFNDVLDSITQTLIEMQVTPEKPRVRRQAATRAIEGFDNLSITSKPKASTQAPPVPPVQALKVPKKAFATPSHHQDPLNSEESSDYTMEDAFDPAQDAGPQQELALRFAEDEDESEAEIDLAINFLDPSKWRKILASKDNNPRDLVEIIRDYYTVVSTSFAHEETFMSGVLFCVCKGIGRKDCHRTVQKDLEAAGTKIIAKYEFYRYRALESDVKGANTVENQLLGLSIPENIRKARGKADSKKTVTVSTVHNTSSPVAVQQNATPVVPTTVRKKRRN
jgi:hypothetical protein